MTRPSVPAGFPGVGQDVFPEQARDLGRDLGLYDSATILEYTPTASAGAERPAWTPQPDPVDARLDPMGSGTTSALTGGRIDESSSHIVSFREGQEITTKDRVRMLGNDWIITAERERTDELIVRVEVRRA